MMSKYTLRYFTGDTWGDISRLILVSQGQEFEDKRFSSETFPAEKPNTPFGQLPVLTVDGKHYTEKEPIERFLAREFELYGSNNQEGYEIDQVMSICSDLRSHYIKYYFAKDETAKSVIRKTIDDEMIPRYLGNIETLMSQKGTGYCVGKKLSLGDIAIFNVINGWVDDTVVSKYPNICAVVNNVKSDDKIKAYLANRKTSTV